MFLERPREGTPPLLNTPSDIAEAFRALEQGSGPIAIDTERAGMFLSDDRACVIQLRREGAGTFLLDALSEPDAVAGGAAFMNTTEWILHSAQDDLPCLMDLEWYPAFLYDTRVAGSLLGLERTGLLPMMEEFLDISIAKGKGQDNWSQRPLDADMLDYAALDVEQLIELNAATLKELDQLGRRDWYNQECRYLLTSARPLSVLDFEHIKGISQLKHLRSLAIAFFLHEARLKISFELDAPVHNILSHSDLLTVAESRTPHRTLSDIVRRNRWKAPRGMDASSLFDAISIAYDQSPSKLRSLGLKQRVDNAKKASPGSPSTAVWEDEDPRSYKEYSQWRTQLESACEDLSLRVDTVITMRMLKALAWAIAGPSGRRLPSNDDRVIAADDFLTAWGMRPWQVELVLNVLGDKF